MNNVEGAKTRAPWARGEPRRLNVVIRAQPCFPAPLGDIAQRQWSAARKEIDSVGTLEKFLGCSTMSAFVGFILFLNRAALGRPLSSATPDQDSQAIKHLLGAVASLDALVDAIPPAAHSLRYGNPAFRDWVQAMRSAAPAVLRPVLSEATAPALPELVSYFQDSFGNVTRIDYGTGHETTFVALLFCLARLGVLTQEDGAALALRVFPAYLALVRRLQTSYWLEPAGSHGVWGLDDYQFVPFVLGSSQLVDHAFIQPSSIHSPAVLEDGKDDYMYLSAVAFVRQVKKGPLAETSPMLNDISGLPSWTRVNTGMMKMYQAEVLSKFPIMQHFLTGNLIPLHPEV